MRAITLRVDLILVAALAITGILTFPASSAPDERNAAELAKQAEKLDKTQFDSKAVRLIDLFAGICMRFPGNPKELRIFVSEKLHLPPIPDNFQSAFVGNKWPGRAWSATDAAGEFVIVTYDNGMCAAQARKATADDTFRYLEASTAITNTALTQTKDERVPIRPGVEMHLRSYTIRSNNNPYNITGSATSAENVAIQSVFTFFPGDLK